jgi:hypothetical protein
VQIQEVLLLFELLLIILKSTSKGTASLRAKENYHAKAKKNSLLLFLGRGCPFHFFRLAHLSRDII